ncbi:hypothetical protein [Polymorphospora lycopeni]|uniref:Secreted protein n=1 Tax=Polymorphospora lycopeni TaxID=3140240 RepID=A0ABV5CZ03_9ACTN
MIRKAVRRWAVVAVAVPVAAAGVRKVSQTLEARRGSSKATRLMHNAADQAQRLFGRKPKRSRLRFGR